MHTGSRCWAPHDMLPYVLREVKTCIALRNRHNQARYSGPYIYMIFWQFYPNPVPVYYPCYSRAFSCTLTYPSEEGSSNTMFGVWSYHKDSLISTAIGQKWSVGSANKGNKDDSNNKSEELNCNKQYQQQGKKSNPTRLSGDRT